MLKPLVSLCLVNTERVKSATCAVLCSMLLCMMVQPAYHVLFSMHFCTYAHFAFAVQTGVGRTGKIWGHEHLNVEPDVFSSAKALGAGVPIGAMMCKVDMFRL